jgi:hypothetical protein
MHQMVIERASIECSRASMLNKPIRTIGDTHPYTIIKIQEDPSMCTVSGFLTSTHAQLTLKVLRVVWFPLSSLEKGFGEGLVNSLVNELKLITCR